ncbi:acetyltransferase, GNAT family [Synechococcus sp. PCC 7335]|nr:acetyltransferase, GNAT family [Synechococcus sp. PCC 7335]
MHQSGSLGRITVFVVGLEFREHGVGTALLSSLEKWFKENNCLRIEVTSGDHREAAHRFYEARGYIQDERRFIKSNVS